MTHGPHPSELELHFYVDYDGDLSLRLFLRNRHVLYTYESSGRFRNFLQEIKAEYRLVSDLHGTSFADYFSEGDFLEACAFTWNSRRLPEPIREDTPVRLCAGLLTYDGLNLRSPEEHTPEPAQPEVIIHDFIF